MQSQPVLGAVSRGFSSQHHQPALDYPLDRYHCHTRACLDIFAAAIIGSLMHVSNGVVSEQWPLRVRFGNY